MSKQTWQICALVQFLISVFVIIAAITGMILGVEPVFYLVLVVIAIGNGTFRLMIDSGHRG